MITTVSKLKEREDHSFAYHLKFLERAFIKLYIAAPDQGLVQLEGTGEILLVSKESEAVPRGLAIGIVDDHHAIFTVLHLCTGPEEVNLRGQSAMRMVCTVWNSTLLDRRFLRFRLQ